ncbi:MAG: agmatinase [bacterium]
MKFRPLHFIESTPMLDGADVVLLGLPWDRTASYRSGSRFGPDEIRIASDSIETFDPDLDIDLLEAGSYYDLGNANIEAGSAEAAVDEMRLALREVPGNLPILGFGGEHTVTLPLVEHALKRHPDLVHVIFDAHADLRDNYEGSAYSHACVARRVFDLIGPERMAMFGIRSGLRKEFDLMRKHGMLYPANAQGMQTLLEKIGDTPIYLSVDLDGFDPGLIPGTGTVEAGGFDWQEYVEMIQLLKGHRIAGADVVELAPDLDPTGRSNVLAARVARTLLGLILAGRS